jgi:hypothetical protein
MKDSDAESPGGARGRRDEGEDGLKEEAASFRAKLVLTLFPFVLILLFLLFEWWLRGRS